MTLMDLWQGLGLERDWLWASGTQRKARDGAWLGKTRILEENELEGVMEPLP